MIEEAGCQGGSLHWDNLDEQEREGVKDHLNKERPAAMQRRKDNAQEKYDKPGAPPLVPNLSCWECTGVTENQEMCGFKCTRQLNLASFYGVTDLKALWWLVYHKLLDTECNRNCCTGECVPVGLGESVGLKCKDCGHISRGGLGGFWTKGRLGIVRMVAVVFSIVTGLSFKHMRSHLGLKFNKNTWTKYVKDIGIVCGEALERDRRTNPYDNAQADEVAFGKRKCHRGHWVRAAGIQWALTIVKVCPVTNRTSGVQSNRSCFGSRSLSRSLGSVLLVD